MKTTIEVQMMSFLMLLSIILMGCREQKVPESLPKKESKTATKMQVPSEADVVAAYIQARGYAVPAEFAELIARHIVTVADVEQVPVELIVGIIEVESHFNPAAVSHANAAGLMQILSASTVKIDQKKKFDIVYNLRTGCQILKEKLANNKGNLTPALVDYSGGAKWYAGKVYENVGRYSMYRDRRSLHLDIRDVDSIPSGAVKKSAKAGKKQ